MVGLGDRILRVHVRYDVDGQMATNLVYIVRTNAVTLGAQFSYERLASWTDSAGKAQQVRSDGDRLLTEGELASFRAVFERLRICSSDAEGKDGPGGWKMQVEFANETRHCFAERWSPNWEGYAPDFLGMSELLYGFMDPLPVASGD